MWELLTYLNSLRSDEKGKNKPVLFVSLSKRDFLSFCYDFKLRLLIVSTNVKTVAGY